MLQNYRIYQEVLTILSLSVSMFSFGATRVPIVYHPRYNISYEGFWGRTLQKLHPFDGSKYGRIADRIAGKLHMNREEQWYQPTPVTKAEKLLVHTPDYLASLSRSTTISHAIDLGNLLSVLPISFLKQVVLEPMEYATGGTILALKLALTYGWAINLSGGYHHASEDHGEGGCIFADVPIALKVLWQTNPNLRVLVIDLDAHSGNGFKNILKNDPWIVYFDVYNKNGGFTDTQLGYRPPANIIEVPLEGGELSSKIFGIPFPDLLAERCISRHVEDVEYFAKLRVGLEEAFNCATKLFGKQPDIIIYNAGSDIDSNDPWGCLNVSEAGIAARDQYIFNEAAIRNIPICMVLSGGYSPRSAEIISNSIVGIVGRITNQSHITHYFSRPNLPAEIE